jgi:hypothetical protein
MRLSRDIRERTASTDRASAARPPDVATPTEVPVAGATPGGMALSVPAVLALQRSAGNRAVAAALATRASGRILARAWKKDPALRGAYVDVDGPAKYNPATLAYWGPKHGGTDKAPVTLTAPQATALQAEIDLHLAWAMNAPVEHGGLLEDTNVRRTAHGSARPAAMTYHHIISRNMLWGFWDKVIKNEEQAHLSGMIGAIIDRGYASLLDGTAKQGAKTAQALGKGDVKTGMGALSEGRALVTLAEQDAMELFTRMYQWMPGNIMHGPDSKLRSDDAGSEFEMGAVAIVGKPHFSVLKKAYENMERYRGMAPGSERTKLLKTIAGQYTQISGKTSISPFDAGQWDHNTKTGKWSIHLPGG